jgi:predicted transposase/invertase (TIGR01784 family)
MKVNPKIDLVFKKLFGSEENKDILLSLINAILPLNQQIAKITLKNPYNVSDYAEGKLSILDIKAEDENGRLYDIEMQIRGSKFYGKRALFYWAKMFGSQLDYVLEDNEDNDNTIEIGYSDLKKCIVMSLIDFTFFEDKKYYHFYTLKDGETNEQHKDLDYLDLYFIELKKYKGKLENVKTTLERWITFLNHANKYDNKSLPKELAEIKEIRKASQKLNAMSLDEQERRYYEAQQKFWLDQNTFMKEALEKAKEKGREEGIEEGIEKGVEIGIEKGVLNLRIETAKTMLANNEPVEKIMLYTGLTFGQIEELRGEMK